MKPILFNTEMVRVILEGRKTVTRRVLKQPFEIHKNGFITKPRGNERLCPYEPPYEVGDVLYVRETWYKGLNRIMYKANYSEDEKFYQDGKEILIKWRPSIHMPKAAARIFLKVTDVRVERLRDIDNPEDEGVRIDCTIYEAEERYYKKFVDFAELWDSTIKPDQLKYYGWEANPYVWVIEFERVDKPEAL